MLQVLIAMELTTRLSGLGEVKFLAITRGLIRVPQLLSKSYSLLFKQLAYEDIKSTLCYCIKESTISAINKGASLCPLMSHLVWVLALKANCRVALLFMLPMFLIN